MTLVTGQDTSIDDCIQLQRESDTFICRRGQARLGS